MYKPVPPSVSFPDLEAGILRFWEENGIFGKSLAVRGDSPAYIFYDGPPFATGLPHYGHLLAGTIKDIIPRYQTMRGKYVERRFGWDTHGLPIEALAQDALGLKGTPDILARGVDVFNEQCRSMVLRYVDDWRRIVRRMGRWVDFDNDYKTMQPSFMESVWWVFQQLWQQGRIYKSHRIMPYSWALETPLSNFEAGSNYKNVQDPAVTVRTPALTGPDPAWGKTWLLVWTTTPWTLPENLAICAGPDVAYVVVRDLTDPDKACYVCAASRLGEIFKKEADREIVARLKGSDLAGWTYEPIFPYFAGEKANGAFRVLCDGYVTGGDGTGLVHIAPAYGEDDFRVCRENGLAAFVDPLDKACAFTDAIPAYAGRFCKDCDRDIIRALKEAGKLVHQATIEHSYPFCPRTDTPLIYRAIDAWYVRVEDLHDRLAKNNEAVRWVPAAVGEKRFANWLKEARDWNISRNRFWGSCIPVWINEDDPNDMICVGSVKELEELSGVKVTDLHKHVIDPILIRKDGKTYRRTPEVLDCWFESGSMPYAQQHYPFERADELARFFPADFIAEGLDQTRGWFYTLMLLGTMLFDKSPFKNVIVNGLVLAEDGRKMSKRLKNYPDPEKILDTYGADALRLYMVHSPIVRAEDLCFSESGVVHALRHLLIPWWNAYSFFTTYAAADGWEPPAGPFKPESANLLDKWILSLLDATTAELAAAMDAYDLQRATRALVDFIDRLCNWYIRRSRRRFWRTENDGDKACAYATLRHVLLTLSKLAAPFVPFLSEAIYRGLRSDDMPESVHLCDFPEAGSLPRDNALEARMEHTLSAVVLGRQLRRDFDLRTRQPLSALHVISRDEAVLAGMKELEAVIAEELNVKTVVFGSDETALADLSAKANFKRLGPKLGPLMRPAATAIATLGKGRLAQLLAGETISVALPDGQTVDISPEDVTLLRTPKAGMAVASEGDIVVALETTLTDELKAEGAARELISRIQAARKEAGLEVSDRIRLVIRATGALRQAAEAFQDLIAKETLAEGIAVEEGGETELLGDACDLELAKA